MQHQESQVVDAVLDAYRQGAFPMADPRTGRIDWYSPDPRALMPLAVENGDSPTGSETPTFHIARSLRSTLRAKRFQMTGDAAFESVMRCCAEPRPERPDSWIDERIVRVYTSLHRAGHAHSIEAWLPATDADRTATATRHHAADEPAPTSPVLSSDGSLVLVGGVYGVSIGAAFFAESMFCRPELGWAVGQGGSPRRLPGTDASKVCLVHLVGHLRRRGYRLLDVQLRNEHTDQFGVYEVRRREYLRALRAACDVNVSWGCFDSRETGCA